MKPKKNDIKFLLFLFYFSFVSASFKCKRSDLRVERMVGYNALLCSIVDNSFGLLASSQRGCFLVCPSNGGGRRLLFSLCEARRIILKIDKMRGWPDDGDINDVKNKKVGGSPLDQVIIDHTRALNEYWCYLEGADLDCYSSSKKKLIGNARLSILNGIRTKKVDQISKGAYLINTYEMPTLLPAS